MPVEKAEVQDDSESSVVNKNANADEAVKSNEKEDDACWMEKPAVVKTGPKLPPGEEWKVQSGLPKDWRIHLTLPQGWSFNSPEQDFDVVVEEEDDQVEVSDGQCFEDHMVFDDQGFKRSSPRELLVNDEDEGFASEEDLENVTKTKMKPQAVAVTMTEKVTDMLSVVGGKQLSLPSGWNAKKEGEGGNIQSPENHNWSIHSPLSDGWSLKSCQEVRRKSAIHARDHTDCVSVPVIIPDGWGVKVSIQLKGARA